MSIENLHDWLQWNESLSDSDSDSDSSAQVFTSFSTTQCVRCMVRSVWVSDGRDTILGLKDNLRKERGKEDEMLRVRKEKRKEWERKREKKEWSKKVESIPQSSFSFLIFFSLSIHLSIHLSTYLHTISKLRVKYIKYSYISRKGKKVNEYTLTTLVKGKSDLHSYIFC